MCFSVAFENKLHLSLIRLVINIDDIARHKLLLLPIKLENVELIFSENCLIFITLLVTVQEIRLMNLKFIAMAWWK